MPSSFNYTIFLYLLLSTSPSVITSTFSLPFLLSCFPSPTLLSTGPEYILDASSTVCYATYGMFLNQHHHYFSCSMSSFQWIHFSHFWTLFNTFFYITFLSVKHESLFTLHGLLSLLIPNQSFSSHNCLKSIMRMSVKWDAIGLQPYSTILETMTIGLICSITGSNRIVSVFNITTLLFAFLISYQCKIV